MLFAVSHHLVWAHSSQQGISTRHMLQWVQWAVGSGQPLLKYRPLISSYFPPNRRFWHLDMLQVAAVGSHRGPGLLHLWPTYADWPLWSRAGG